jgi:phosphonate transport system ATP-binding protein
VVLATEFLPRIVGLRAGSVVFDGPASEVDQAVLTRIYGDEDWTAITNRLQGRGQASKRDDDLGLALETAA